MDLDHWTALALFAMITSITPGPNNFMLLNSGTNFGVRRSIPHLIGISIGFPTMLVLLCVGILPVLILQPSVLLAIKAIGMAYLAYLAWRIATATHVGLGDNTSAKPLSLWQGALFQWVNPKAWVVAAGALSSYLSPQFSLVAQLTLMAGIFLLMAFSCCGVWLLFGQSLQRWFAQPMRLRWFNRGAALVLLLSLFPELEELVAQLA